MLKLRDAGVVKSVGRCRFPVVSGSVLVGAPLQPAASAGDTELDRLERFLFGRADTALVAHDDWRLGDVGEAGVEYKVEYKMVVTDVVMRLMVFSEGNYIFEFTMCSST